MVCLNRDDSFIGKRQYYVRVPGRGYINLSLPAGGIQTIVFKNIPYSPSDNDNTDKDPFGFYTIVGFTTMIITFLACLGFGIRRYMEDGKLRAGSDGLGDYLETMEL